MTGRPAFPLFFIILVVQVHRVAVILIPPLALIVGVIPSLGQNGKKQPSNKGKQGNENYSAQTNRRLK